MNYIETWDDVYYVATQKIMENIANFLPKFLGAVLIIVVGVVLAFYVQTHLSRFLRRFSNLQRVVIKLLATSSKWIIISSFFLTALIQMGIAKNILLILFTGLIFMISLAGGLAFGLGGRDLAKKIIESIKEKRK